MATAFEIPTAPKAQSFSISLAGVTYGLKFRWNVPSAAWILDISDSAGNPLIQGIPLVTSADLLEQYAYVGIGGQLIVQTDGDVNAVPTYENLGSRGHLYFVVP